MDLAKLGCLGLDLVRLDEVGLDLVWVRWNSIWLGGWMVCGYGFGLSYKIRKTGVMCNSIKTLFSSQFLRSLFSQKLQSKGIIFVGF